MIFRILLPIFFASNVLGHGWGGGRGSSYTDYDCGGCDSAPVIEVSNGCHGGSCGGSDHSYDHSSSSNYHYSSVTSHKKKFKKNYVSVVSQPVIHRSYTVRAAPVIKKTYSYSKPVVHSSYHDSGCDTGPCGGGSKIIKIIKKTTTYTDDACGYGGCQSGGYADYQPEPVVVKKITRVVNQPKVVKVVKVVDSDSHYGGSSGYGGGRGGGGYGGGAAASGAFAFASASAGGSAGGYHSGGSPCKYNCGQWK